MDKPMTFIEWCSSNGKIPYSVGIEEAYEAGQQSQQAKVEGLQKRVGALEKAEFVLARIRSIASKRLLESILIKEVRQALMGGRMKGHYYIVSASFRSEIPMPWTHTISITPVVISTNLITQKVLSEIQSSVQEQVSKGEHTDAHDIAIHGLSYLGYMTKEEFEGGDQ